MSAKVTGDELIAMGYQQGKQVGIALRLANGQLRERPMPEVQYNLRALLGSPDTFKDNAVYGELARAVMQSRAVEVPDRAAPAPLARWGDQIEDGAVKQIELARQLPCAAATAMMPDAHQGYGLPVGGVLATYDAVIPYAVGVDIGCRMKLSITDLPPSVLGDRYDPWLEESLHRGTLFGLGGEYKDPQHHPVLDEDWNVTKLTAGLKDKAAKQLGTSGTGNHFVEWGTVDVTTADLGIPTGTYVALLSHSGSRGPGGKTCDYYSKLAQRMLPPRLAERFKYLAWLPMDREEGQEYWAAMNLMGKFAEANHAVIHRNVLREMGTQAIAGVENHHNFAWEEELDGRKVYVHRKGATPAGPGVLGFIPGSMADPGFIVKGKGGQGSINSSSHGAGRRMSRKAAREKFTWKEWRPILAERRITLLSAGLDEMPGSYKDIREVMAAQADLVDTIGTFHPRIVKMAEDGEAED